MPYGYGYGGGGSMVEYVVEIYEGGSYPVVTHKFHGQNQDEALRYYQAHLQSDSFLRQCTETGQWTGESYTTYSSGATPCQVRAYWQMGGQRHKAQLYPYVVYQQPMYYQYPGYNPYFQYGQQFQPGPGYSSRTVASGG